MPDRHLSRRMFFVHSAHATIGVSVGMGALSSLDFGDGQADAAEAPPELQVCFVSGSDEYESDRTLKFFEEYLAKQGAAKCLWASAAGLKTVNGIEQLDHCDCAVFFTRRLEIDGSELDTVKRYCRSGKAVIGIRTASHGFQNWLAMDKEVFGGDYQKHHKPEPVDVQPAAAAKAHPVLSGVEPFISQGTLYRNPDIARDATVLLEGTISKDKQPVAWVRNHGKGRVFYTSLGQQDDFREPSFLRLLQNAIHWTCGRDDS